MAVISAGFVAAMLLTAIAASPAPPVKLSSFPVAVTVDAIRPVRPVNPVWRFFGADEPNYATMKDGRTTLAELGRLAPDRVFFRAHNMLTSGDGTPALKWGSTGVYTEDAAGRPHYNWMIVDRIFDQYRAAHVRPYVEVGFMPEALSVRPRPYQHDWRPGSGTLRTGWAFPPKDYARWEELVRAWVAHMVDRYGRAEVATWWFEVWNEANLSDSYWGGTRDEFFRLHDAAVRGVRAALPEAKVGGPDLAGAGDDFLPAFLAHLQAAGTPTDFLSFHAKGKPDFVGADTPGGGHVEMGIAAHLQAADHEYAAIDAAPAFRTKPIVIGESDPEGCAACKGPANAYRNGTMYSSYTAASFPRLEELARRRGLDLQGILSWAFEYEDQPYFAGFRQLTSAGIDLPVMNMFRLFAGLRGDYLQAESDHQLPLDAVMRDGVRGSPDVGTLATRDGNRLAVLVWHYHDDDVAGPDAAIHLALAHLPAAFAQARVTQYRIDGTHANSYAAWQAMGSPIAPTDAERTRLIDAARLAPINGLPPRLAVTNGTAALDFTLPRQGVSLVVVEAGADKRPGS